MLSLDEIEKQIQAQIPGGVLKCTQAVFGQAVIDRITASLSIPILDVLNPNLTKQNGNLLIDGKASLFGLTETDIQIIVGEKDQQINFSLSFSTHESWLVSDKFTALKSTVFDQWHIPSATIVVSSFSYQDTSTNAHFVAGLNIVFDLALPSSLSWANLLLGQSGKKALLTIDGNKVGLDVIGSVMQIAIQAPDYEFRVRSADGLHLDLDTIVHTLLPSLDIRKVNLPAISFSHLELVLDTMSAIYSFAADMQFGADQKGWVVGPVAMKRLYFQVMMMGPMSDIKQNPKSVLAGGEASIGDTTLDVLVDIADGWSISGTLRDLKLSALGALLTKGFAKPDFLPDLELKEIGLSLDYTQDSVEVKLQALANDRWQFPGCGEINQIELTLGCDMHDPAKTLAGSITISGVGVTVVPDALEVHEFSITASVSGLNNWAVSGSLKVSLFGITQTLVASYDVIDTQKTLKLSLDFTPALPVITLETVGQLALKDFALCYVTSQTASADAASAWHVSGAGSLNMTNVCKLGGNIVLDRPDNTSVNLAFKIDGQARLPIKLPTSQPAIVFSGGQLAINKVNQQWSMSCQTTITLEDWPHVVQSILPADHGITVSLDIEPDRFELKTLNWNQALTLQLPPIQRGEHAAIPLGSASATLQGFTVTISKAMPLALTVNAGIQLPDSVNYLFGVDNGKPVRRWMETSKPIGFCVTGGMLGESLPSLKFDILDSPLTLIHLEPGKQPNERWWNINFGRAGSLRLLVPTLVQSGDSFAASGGFEQDLKIPLFLLKDLCSGVLPDAFLNAIPDTVPLSDVSLLDDTGHLRLDQLQNYASKLGIQLPQALIDAFNELSKVIENLPDRLKYYLGASLPSGFRFSIDAKATGDLTLMAVAGKEGAENDPALRESVRILLPTFPTMVGIEFRKIEFGPVLGGSLFKLDLDMRLDFFDLPVMVASIALGNIYPTIKKAHTTYISDELSTFIVYETGIPIPIPLYFDKLGLDFQGPLGTSVASSVSFTPKLELAEFFAALGDVWGFLSKDKSTLLPDKPKQVFSATLALNESFIELPRFLGDGDTPGAGKVLGVKGKPVFEVDLAKAVIDAVYPTIAHTLNGIKLFSIREFVAAIPFEQRVNNVSLALGPVHISAGWAVTTEAEYAANFGPIDQSKLPDGVKKLVALDEADRQALLQNLPGTHDPAAADRGLVLLMGRWGVENIAELFIGFALAAGGEQGVATGILMKGSISPVIDLMLAGSVAANATKGAEAFDAAASSTLTVAGVSVWDGAMQLHVDRNQFFFDSHFNFLDESWPIYATTTAQALLSDTDFHVSGEGKGRFLVLDVDCKLYLGKDGISVSMHAINDQIVNDFSILQSDDGKRLSLAGEMKFFSLYQFTAHLDIDQTRGYISAGLDSSLLDGLITEHLALEIDKAEHTTFSGDANFIIFGDKLFVGHVALTQDKFAFDGTLTLFNKNFPVYVIGKTSGVANQSAFRFDGSLQIKIGFIDLSGTLYFGMAPDHLVLGGVWLSYGKVNLELRHQGNVLSGSFLAAFGPAGTTITVKIIPGTQLDLGLSVGTASYVNLVASFSGKAGQAFSTRGNSSLKITGRTLIQGAFDWSNNGFTLSQGINFGLVKADLKGGLDSKGLLISGGYEIGIPIPVIGRLAYGVHITITQNSADVKIVLPAGLSVSGAIVPYQNTLAICFSFGYKIWSVYITIPLGSLPVISWSRPRWWPRTLKAVAPLMRAPQKIYSHNSDDFLDALVILLELKEAEEATAAKLWQALEDYQVTSSEHDGPLYVGAWVQAHRSTLNSDIFTELADYIKVDGFSVATASAMFELTDRKKISMHLLATLNNEPLNIIVVFKQNNVQSVFEQVKTEIEKQCIT